MPTTSMRRRSTSARATPYTITCKRLAAPQSFPHLRMPKDINEQPNPQTRWLHSPHSNLHLAPDLVSTRLPRITGEYLWILHVMPIDLLYSITYYCNQTK